MTRPVNLGDGSVLVLGGARSGKSAYAERLFEGCGPALYLATAEALDGEMRDRIAAHRARRSADWRTLEVPLALPEALARHDGPALVDCLTLWLANLLLGGHDHETEAAALERVLAQRAAPTVLVANEVGLGIVPGDALSRRYRDAAGRLNQRIASVAARVVFIAAGLPLVLK